MWRKFGDFEADSDFMAWASTICFYEAKNFIRIGARSPLYFDDNLLATLASERLADLPSREHRLDALAHCLSKLKVSENHLIKAAYLDSTPNGISKLAAQMNRAPQTLYNKLNLLRRQLAECVQRNLQTESA